MPRDRGKNFRDLEDCWCVNSWGSKEDEMKLKDKVAIVTGASRGIGKAIALDFAREGARVVVAARTEVEGKLSGTIHNTVKEIESFGGKALALKCDVTSEKEVENMVRRALDQFGGISVLVNNAAVGYYKTLLETPLKHWDLIMKVNVGGPFICIKAVLPTMIEIYPPRQPRRCFRG